MKASLKPALFGLNARAVDRYFQGQAVLQEDQFRLLEAILEVEKQQSGILKNRIRQAEARLTTQGVLFDRATELHDETTTLASGLQPALDALVQELERVYTEAARMASPWERERDREREQAPDENGSRVLPFRIASRDALSRPAAEQPVQARRAEPAPGWRPGIVGDVEPATPVTASEAALFAAPRGAVLPTPPSMPSTPNVPEQPEQLRTQIAGSLLKLLRGKVVGQDLVDAAGRVIAAQGADITADVAARAEQAGLLPELVLHMAWPPVAES